MKKFFIKTLRNLRKNKLEYLFSIILSIITIVFILFVLWSNNISWQSFVANAWQEILITALSIVCTAFIALVIRKIVLIIMNTIEDIIKLNPDYAELINCYSKSINAFVKIDINPEDFKRLKLNHRSYSYFNDNQCIIPIEKIFFKSRDIKFILKIKDKKKKHYHAPSNILCHYDENIQAHEYSYIYNNLIIRIDDCIPLSDGNGIYLKTSRTTYFDSLATNRSIDYTWSNGLSIRNLYTYGKKILPLQDMPLSNHLGINGIIRTKDDYIVCIYRNGEASIGKRTYSISVGSAIQTVVAENQQGYFTEQGLKNAIDDMIYKELNLYHTDYQFKTEDNIIAFYRDWVEGGKPQLLFYVDCLLNAKQLKERFKNRLSKINKEISFISLTSLKTATITADCIVINHLHKKGKYYKVLPSVAASVYMYYSYLIH